MPSASCSCWPLAPSSVTGGLQPQLPGAATAGQRLRPSRRPASGPCSARPWPTSSIPTSSETGQRRGARSRPASPWIFKLAIALGNGGSGWSAAVHRLRLEVAVQSRLALRDPGAAVDASRSRASWWRSGFVSRDAADRRGMRRRFSSWRRDAAQSERAGLVHAVLGSCRQAQTSAACALPLRGSVASGVSLRRRPSPSAGRAPGRPGSPAGSRTPAPAEEAVVAVVDARPQPTAHGARAPFGQRHPPVAMA